MNMIRFTEAEATKPAFAIARKLLHEQGVGIHDTVAALVKTGVSELYAKSVVVHVKTSFYAAR
jgi:hypothetical protein